ncbi:MAG: hypothetical protein AAB319_06735 [Pseudomonadota bacterium]
MVRAITLLAGLLAALSGQARIGGWRVYAREAREPVPAPRDSVRATPATPAGHPHAGHGK